MSQQINLYHPIFRKQPKKFSATTMLQASALVVLGVLLIWGYTQWQVKDLRAQIQQVENQQVAASKRLTEATQQFATHKRPLNAQSEIARLEQEIAARTRIQQLLQQGNLGNARGYSEHLLAFGRQSLAGVWLTEIDIAGSGERLVLEGRSTAPELVPQYLQRLTQERALAGSEFKVFQLTRPMPKDRKPAPAYVEFRAGTAAADAKEDPAVARAIAPLQGLTSPLTTAPTAGAIR